jgi:predicted aconitase
VALRLSASDEADLSGARGRANQIAMRLIVRVAEAMGAERLLDISGAHIDSCLYQGQVGLDWAERLVASGGRVVVPTTLNVSALDLIHPELFRGGAETAGAARRLTECYEELGCRPTWTCAPYQLPERPGFGDHVAWAESNAIVFANSVLGARTNRYGDFVDIAAALTGRVPATGLHLEHNRVGRVMFRVERVPPHLLDRDVLYPVLGYLIGRTAGTAVPVVEGLPPGLSEDRLKGMGAAAAAAGAVGLIHVVGSTPEAPDVATALGGRTPDKTFVVDPTRLRDARDQLSVGTTSDLGVVSLGTPHYSVSEFARLVELMQGVEVATGVSFYVSTSRAVLAEVELRGWGDSLGRAGVRIVTDTCTYVTPIIEGVTGSAMTDSAKWAYYAPGNLGLDVVFASVEECVASAVTGSIRLDDHLWDDD